ncbi:MAG: WecB/TagA/CpsF family glycosyltransferase [Lachnospiraceae bacterium]|nr:WecB/TagA/CpsF family glycosyltransferase [Lachnospiraceae bacterium]
MRKINILGLNLQDYTLREKMRLAEGYLRGGALNTIACVSAKMLMRAGEDTQQKEWLEAMDVIVYCDKDILDAAGITAHNRLREVENNSFLKEFCKKIAREKRTVYLLADSNETMELLENGLLQLQESVRVAPVGRSILRNEETESSTDTVVNEINDKAPNVILSLMEYPKQEAFVFCNKNRINADLWLGLQKENLLLYEDYKGIRALMKGLQRKIFQRKVHQYENQEKAEQ